MTPRVAAVAVGATLCLAVSGGCALHRQPTAGPAAHDRPADETDRNDREANAPASTDTRERPDTAPEPVAAPTPRLLADEELSRDLILARILSGRELLDLLSGRTLVPEQARQIEIGARFLEEAAESLEEGSLGRADVLSEKALALIEDVSRDD